MWWVQGESRAMAWSKTGVAGGAGQGEPDVLCWRVLFFILRSVNTSQSSEEGSHGTLLITLKVLTVEWRTDLNDQGRGCILVKKFLKKYS